MGSRWTQTRSAGCKWGGGGSRWFSLKWQLTAAEEITIFVFTADLFAVVSVVHKIISQWSERSRFSCIASLSLPVLLLSPFWVRRVQGYLFDMNQSTFISFAFWKPFMFSFSFCPHFIHYISQTHTALSAFCCCCCCHWLFTARQQIAFCWVLLQRTSTSSAHTLSWTWIYRQTCTCSDESWFFSSSFASGTVFICVFYFFIFIFCWQLNGTGRFHGLASLDDITAIISTPPLGGFQVAPPTSPIWCSIQTQFSVMHRYVDDMTRLMGSCFCPLCLQYKIKIWLFDIAT